jgi:TonB family protein
LRREPALAALAFTTAILVAAGQSAPPISPTPAPAQSTNIAPASGSTPAPGASQSSDNTAAHITPPIVITQSDLDYPYETRKKKISGTCLISFTVDTDGIPRSVHVVKGLEPSLDANAVQSIETWRFKPARKDGKTPVPFDLTAEVSFRLLDKHKSGGVIAILARPGDPGTLLSSDGSRVIPLIPIKQIAPEYPSDEKRHRINGDCTLGMIVDSEGVPQNVHIVKSLGPAFDESALEAVKQWRYKPALKDGVPVSVETQVIVKFEIDEHRKFW